MQRRNRGFGFFFLIGVLIAGFCGLMGVYMWYQADRDLDSVLARAQVAGDREDMLEYMIQFRDNMKKYGLESGHTAYIFKTPINDMALHYKTVNRVIERIEEIGDLSKSDTAYQVALDDLRGVIRELPNVGDGWVWIHGGPFFLAGLLLGVILCMFDSAS